MAARRCPTQSCSSRQSVLERCAFLLEMRTGLFGQRSRDKTSQRTSRGNASHSAVSLRKCCQPCTRQGRCDGTWDFRLCQTGSCLEQQFQSVLLVHHDFEVFTSAPAWAWRRTAWGCLETLQEFLAVQFQRRVRMELASVLRWRSTHLLRALVLQFSQRVEISRCQSVRH